MARRPDDQPSLGQLVSSVTADVQSLVKGQIELTKVELQASAQQTGRALAPLIVAGVLAFLAFVFLLVTLAYVLVALGLPIWAGFGIVTLVLVIVAGVLGYIGRRNIDKIKGPERSLRAIEETRAVLAPSSDTPAA